MGTRLNKASWITAVASSVCAGMLLLLGCPILYERWVTGPAERAAYAAEQTLLRQRELVRQQVGADGAIQSALRMFYMHVGRYPGTVEGLNALLKQPAYVRAGKAWRGPYLDARELKDQWGHDIVYECPGTHNTDSFDLSSPGPDGRPGTPDDITNWWNSP